MPDQLGKFSDIISQVSNILGKEVNSDSLIRPSSLEAHLIASALRSNNYYVDYSTLKRGFRLKDILINSDDSVDPNANTVNLIDCSSSNYFSDSLESKLASFGLHNVGIDIISINNLFPFPLPFDLKTDKNLISLFTFRELSYASSRPNELETLSGLLAAKEALVKSKVSLMPEEFCQIEINHDLSGTPIFKDAFLSISHDNGNAIAIAIPKSLAPQIHQTINLFLYCDSLGFRRSPQSQDFSITYPFIIQNELLRNGYKVNLVIRGRGGTNIREFNKFLMTDLGYINNSSDSIKNIMVIQIGVVDAVSIFNGPFDIFGKISTISMTFANFLRFGYKKFLFTLIARRNKNIIQLLGRVRSVETFVVGQPYKQSQVCSQDILMGVDLMMQKFVKNKYGYIQIDDSKIERKNIYFDGDHLTEAGHVFYGKLISKSIIKQLTQVK